MYVNTAKACCGFVFSCERHSSLQPYKLLDKDNHTYVNNKWCDQLTGREMDMSWVFVVGSVSGNSAKGPETWHGFAFDVETPHSQSYKSICLKLY